MQEATGAWTQALAEVGWPWSMSRRTPGSIVDRVVEQPAYAGFGACHGVSLLPWCLDYGEYVECLCLENLAEGSRIWATKVVV